jgi:hypothetical protein
MRKKSKETTDHLLLHCKVAKELWDMVYVWSVVGYAQKGGGSVSLLERTVWLTSK